MSVSQSKAGCALALMMVLPLAGAGAAAAAGVGAAALVPLTQQSIRAQQAAMAAGQISAARLTRSYLQAIAAIDRAGPSLHSVIAVSPIALQSARALDKQRAAGKLRGDLHGICVLVKDNIETADLPTTAGSLALKDNLTQRDAPLVARLRAAGAIILGKTNLSEWANIRSRHSISGWSAIGGRVKNPYVLDRSTCGSSAGSAAAVAAGLAAAAVGTETDGSITCPAAMNGLVGLKPTVGLISRTYVVPISSSQDTPGPMTRTVEEAAILLTVLSGSDAADPATKEADAHKINYAAALKTATLAGKRLGVLKILTGYNIATDAVFAQAVATLRSQGAQIVTIDDYEQPKELYADEHIVLTTELKATLNSYLRSTPANVAVRNLADVIAFDKATQRETVLFADDVFEEAQATHGLDDPAYLAAKAQGQQLAGAQGIDKLLAQYKLDALIAPTTSPAWRVDTVSGDHFSGSASGLPAIAGYPHLTVPMGQVQGLPVGISFIGTAWSEAQLLQLGYAFEQATHSRQPPTYAGSVEESRATVVNLSPASP
jgi:amidase